MCDRYLTQVIHYPFLPDLSQVSRTDTLYRHAGYAAERGFHTVAQEYLAEAARREEQERAVA